MKVKRTFFNSRNERLYWNYTDTNNYLFTILFGNIAEVDVSRITDVEYNLMKQENIPSVIKVC